MKKVIAMIFVAVMTAMSAQAQKIQAVDMDHWEFDSSKGWQKLIYYYYTVDHGYVDEDEFKTRSKELNKGYVGDMPLSELLEYERAHNIPALSPEMLQVVKGLKKGQGKDKE